MDDADLEACLRRARPLPDPEFVRATETKLLGDGRRSVRPLRLAAGMAGGFAALVLTLSLAGTGPLGGGDDSVSADDPCRTVVVVRRERIPSLRVTPDGTPRIVYSRRPVERAVRRCR